MVVLDGKNLKIAVNMLTSHVMAKANKLSMLDAKKRAFH
jgi:hypothetical protein